MFYGEQRMTPCLWPLSTRWGCGARVVLYDPDGTSISLYFKLEFSYFNNEVEAAGVVRSKTHHSTSQRRILFEKDCHCVLLDCHSKAHQFFLEHLVGACSSITQACRFKPPWLQRSIFLTRWTVWRSLRRLCEPLRQSLSPPNPLMNKIGVYLWFRISIIHLLP